MNYSRRSRWASSVMRRVTLVWNIQTTVILVKKGETISEHELYIRYYVFYY